MGSGEFLFQVQLSDDDRRHPFAVDWYVRLQEKNTFIHYPEADLGNEDDDVTRHRCWTRRSLSEPRSVIGRCSDTDISQSLDPPALPPPSDPVRPADDVKLVLSRSRGGRRADGQSSVSGRTPVLGDSCVAPHPRSLALERVVQPRWPLSPGTPDKFYAHDEVDEYLDFSEHGVHNGLAFVRNYATNGINKPPYDTGDDWESNSKRQTRPCKAKRKMYNKLVAKSFETIAQKDLAPDEKKLILPYWLTDNPRLFCKFERRLQAHAKSLQMDYEALDLVNGAQGYM